MNQQRFFIRVSGGLGALCILLGAFGAHALKEKLSPDVLTVFETGVRYHMYHALALLAVSLGSASLWKHDGPAPRAGRGPSG